MINIFFRQGPSTFNNSAEVDGVDDAGQLMVGGMSGAKTASWSGGGGRERGGGAGGVGGRRCGEEERLEKGVENSD